MDRTAAYARLDGLLEAFAREHHAPGLVYGVIVDGELDRFGAFGVQDAATRRPADRDSVFRIASMTKAFTALTVLALRDQGKLSLDAPVETILPQFAALRPSGDGPLVRVRDLIHHTGGFVTDDPWGDRQLDMPAAAFDALIESGLPVSRPPGVAFEYSNFGYAVLGRIVETVTGRPYPEVVRDTVLGPLGMASSGFEVGDIPPETRATGHAWIEEAWVPQPMLAHGAFGAMGGLWTSAADYARYVAWLLSAWPPRGEPEAGPLTRATVREIALGYGPPQARAWGDHAPIPAVYGGGMIVATDPELGLCVTHSGGLPGYGSNVLLLPERGVGLFAFVNVTYAPAATVVRQAALELHRAGAIPPRALPSNPDLEWARDTILAAYAAGDIEAAPDAWAMNFRLDVESRLWAARLARLHDRCGAPVEAGPLSVSGALGAGFQLTCERGVVEASFTLAPTTPPTIQSLRLSQPTP